ncbi:ATP-binding protein [Candidatus Babeliales bacterium]|nr:ATP-binding protein [Candidatus Babeliales bacterium]MBP9843338.1 ATP-binding protein [Candidatus Babeliales bacterium]
MRQPKIIIRNIQLRLQQAIARSPIIFIKGPRQSGKTTLMQSLQGYHFVSLDDFYFLDLALADPMRFIQQLPKPVIIDEVQRAPHLFLAIKHDIDRNRIPGRYVLTGSADPLLINHVGDSLAGRVEFLTLYPFSQGELQGIVDSFVDRVWTDESLLKLSCEKIETDDLHKRMIVGGYPTVQNIDQEARLYWFRDYVSTILRKDITDLSKIEKINDIPRLLSLCAGRAGSLVNTSELSRDSGLNNMTLSRYIALLEALFMVMMQPAWSTNLTKRLIKSPKTYLVDTGLLCWLRGITLENIATHEKGHILENFVVNELMRQMSWNKSFASMYHFRSVTNEEVDIILERIDGKIVGIEVKSSSYISPKDLKGLQFLQESVPHLWHQGIILYGGQESFEVAPGIVVLPISALWAA